MTAEAEADETTEARCSLRPAHLCGKTRAEHSSAVSNSEKFQYMLDRLLATRARFCCVLVVVYAVVVSTASVFTYWANVSDNNGWAYHQCIWTAWCFLIDSGTQSNQSSPNLMAAGSMITIIGILYWSAVLGIVVDIIREKMDSLRQGKSKIVEQDHTIILGWTEKTAHVVLELCKANQSESGGVIAILAPMPKGEMETELELHLPTKQRLGTRVIFRSGSPLVVADLLRVSIHKARSVIILATSLHADEADAYTLRTMLTLRALPGQMKGHIVAEVCDEDNTALVRLVGGPAVETVVSQDIIGRLMLMSVRQPGLARVYESLLGFEGDEFYMSEWPELTGEEFGSLALRFSTAVPLGVLMADGTLSLRPAASYQLAEGDKVIVIAEDNDSYQPEPFEELEVGDAPCQDEAVYRPEKVLFCGWRRDVHDIICQLDRLLHPRSELHLMTHTISPEDRDECLKDDGLDPATLVNLRLVHHHGNSSVRRKMSALPVGEFSCCMILSDDGFAGDTMRADSHSLATLLLFRDLQSQVCPQDMDCSVNFASPVSVSTSTRKDSHMMEAMASMARNAMCPIVCEILDPHTQATIARNASLSAASDFCQTNKLIAQVLAMVSEERNVNIILTELLGSSVCSTALVPSSRYADEGEIISFAGLSKRAMSAYSESIIGYQQRGVQMKTILNPRDKQRKLVWDKFDLAILTAPERHRGRSILDFHPELEQQEEEQEADASGGPPPRDCETWKKSI